MGEPGVGAAVIGWVVSKLLENVGLALKDNVNLPKYCEQLNAYVQRITPLVSAAQGSSSRSALPQGNGDIEVNEWLQEVKLVLEKAGLLVAKCGALPAGKLNFVKHFTKHLKLSRQIQTLTRRLKELANTEATWACLANQVAIQDSVAAQAYPLEKILNGTEDNQILVNICCTSTHKVLDLSTQTRDMMREMIPNLDMMRNVWEEVSQVKSMLDKYFTSSHNSAAAIIQRTNEELNNVRSVKLAEGIPLDEGSFDVKNIHAPEETVGSVGNLVNKDGQEKPTAEGHGVRDTPLCVDGGEMDGERRRRALRRWELLAEQWRKLTSADRDSRRRSGVRELITNKCIGENEWEREWRKRRALRVWEELTQQGIVTELIEQGILTPRDSCFPLMGIRFTPANLVCGRKYLARRPLSPSITLTQWQS